MTDEGYVTFGRWQEAHDGTLRRLAALEAFQRELAGAETAHESMTARITALEQAGKSEETSERGRRDRVWLIVLGIMTGVICPLIVTTLVAWFHLHAVH